MCLGFVCRCGGGGVEVFTSSGFDVRVCVLMSRREMLGEMVRGCEI